MVWGNAAINGPMGIDNGTLAQATMGQQYVMCTLVVPDALRKVLDEHRTLKALIAVELKPAEDRELNAWTALRSTATSAMTDEEYGRLCRQIDAARERADRAIDKGSDADYRLAKLAQLAYAQFHDHFLGE